MVSKVFVSGIIFFFFFFCFLWSKNKYSRKQTCVSVAVTNCDANWMWYDLWWRSNTPIQPKEKLCLWWWWWWWKYHLYLILIENVVQASERYKATSGRYMRSTFVVYGIWDSISQRCIDNTGAHTKIAVVSIQQSQWNVVCAVNEWNSSIRKFLQQNDNQL